MTPKNDETRRGVRRLYEMANLSPYVIREQPTDARGSVSPAGGGRRKKRTRKKRRKKKKSRRKRRK